MKKMKKALSLAAIAAAVVTLAPIDDAFAGDDHRRNRHHDRYYDRDHDRGRSHHHHHHHHYHRPPPPPPVVYHYYAPPPRPPATVIYRDVYRDYPVGNSFMLNVQIDGRR